MTRLAARLHVGLLLTLASALAPVAVNAKVFWRWGRGAYVQKLQAIGAKQAYESDVTVNGVPGRLSVLAFDGSLVETTDRIVSVIGTNGVQAGNGLLIGTLPGGSGSAAVNIVAIGLQQRTLVFHIAMEGTPRDPAPWPIQNAPLCPGGHVLFGFENRDTRTRLAVVRTAESATSVRTFYDAHFLGAGWNLLTPRSNSLAVFMKGGTLCCVLASEETGAGAATRVVVLEKPMAAP